MTRKSVRAFTDQPVPLETIRKIMEVAQRSPSGTNTQPWHAYVCTGEIRKPSPVMCWTWSIGVRLKLILITITIQLIGNLFIETVGGSWLVSIRPLGDRKGGSRSSARRKRNFKFLTRLWVYSLQRFLPIKGQLV